MYNPGLYNTVKNYHSLNQEFVLLLLPNGHYANIAKSIM
jgi:hypothetical protein